MAVSTMEAGIVSFLSSSPASFVANQNDFNLGAGCFVRISSSGAYNITGLAGGEDGRIACLVNVGANTITLTNQDAASSAANRMILAAGQSQALTPDDTILLIYDNTTARWRQISATLLV